ncbi:MAG: cupin domain-containing protein [Candidatus Latescibacteria bacterium]|nr:cupin domain-containing protein [Candidatus Latescibacterota bacterium]
MAIDSSILYSFSTTGPTINVLHSSDRMQVMVVCLDDGQEIPPHNGPCDVLLYVLAGRGVLTIGGEEVIAQTGTALVVPSMVVRGIRSRGRFAVLCVTNNCGVCALDLQAVTSETAVVGGQWSGVGKN